jgi:uncharacterized membrane protein
MAGLIALLTVIASLIRIVVPHGLAVEEIVAVDQANHSLGGLFHALLHGGVHPPLHPLVEWLIVHTLGSGDFAVRLPSLIAGIALVPAVAALGQELFDRRTAVVAALLAAVAPILVWYSQEVSVYALVTLFGTLAVLGALRATRRGSPHDWALHTVAAALALWSGWSGIFIVLASELVVLDGVLRRRRDNEAIRSLLAGWAVDSAGLACQLVPLVILFVAQLHRAGGLSGLATVAASPVSFYTAVSNVSWALFGFHPSAVTAAFSALWPLGMLASLLLIGRGTTRASRLLLACALIPMLGTLVLGLLASGAFDVRYAVAGVPAAMVLLASIVRGWIPGRAGRGLVLVGVLVVLVGAPVDQQIDPNNPRRYDYGPALTQVRREAGHGAAVYFEPSELKVVLGRDAPALRAKPLSKQLPARTQASRVVLISSFTGRPAVRALLNRDLGALRATRHLVSFHAYPGVEVWSFR